MIFHAGSIYHLYNKSNNKRLLFHSHRNYIFFLEKIKRFISPHCDILAYCLMPNHFHLLIHTDERCEKPAHGNCIITKNVMSEGVRLLLSSYSKAINKQEGKSGNLFQQKTKAKPVVPEYSIMGKVNESHCGYDQECFNYIHQNPVKAGIVMNACDWKYSSYNYYFENQSDTLCNIKLGAKFFVCNVPHL